VSVMRFARPLRTDVRQMVSLTRHQARAALLLLAFTTGCGGRAVRPDVAAATVAGGDTRSPGAASAPVAPLDSIRSIPVARSQPATVRISIRERFGNSLHGPPMYIVNGHTLGRRDDGTIDRDAAQRALARLDPRTISSIQVLKGGEAVQRFGPAAADGVALIELVPHAPRAKDGNP
jgi:hypothetical protein